MLLKETMLQRAGILLETLAVALVLVQVAVAAIGQSEKP
jgi:hypothetical protein